MRYEEFVQEIKDHVQEYVGDTAKVTEETVLKNNAVKLHGISIMPTEGNISPTIYLDGYYEHFEKGENLSDIILNIIERYEANKFEKKVNIDFFSDYKEVEKRVLCKLISYEMNEELLQEIPYVRYLDLAVIFYCTVLHDEIGSATILIYNRHMKLWNVEVEELYTAAQKNTRKLMGFQIRELEEIMTEMLVEGLRAELKQQEKEEIECPSKQELMDYVLPMLHSMCGEGQQVPMYVLSNLEKLNGASCILFKDVLNGFAEQIKLDFFIIPSSIHEVILVPAGEDEREDHLRLTQMVQEVNATQVEAEEVLANHVYYYSREKCEVLSM